ncbi:MAG: phytanoyl-CoA dioxygenase family protein [Planctomycetes bacterium]|nr:phytanoyl-CoA dioxygenase family protein [Planctomycetota bacterium]
MMNQELARAFARDGYLRLNGMVDAAACAALADETWAVLPSHWRRDDPASWHGEVTDSCHAASVDQRGGHLKYQMKALADHPSVVTAFQPGSPMHAFATELVGKPLHRIRLRGLYVVAPTRHPHQNPAAPSPHLEAHPAQIIALCYLEDVAPGGGGLLVWPGSHHAFHPAFRSKLDYVAGERLADVYARYRDLAPVELPGQRGDVILIHNRLLHSPSINRRRRLRLAFLCDYTSLDHTELCQQLPGSDPFEDWPGVKRWLGDERIEPARCRPWSWWQRLRHSQHARNRPSKSRAQSSINKADASNLVRERRPGDVWLSISDSPKWFEHRDSLDPMGSNLTAAGIHTTWNGQRLQSRSRGDITVRLSDVRPENRLEIQGIDRQLWVRVLELRSPFSASRRLHAAAIAADKPTVVLTVAAPAEPAAISER